MTAESPTRHWSLRTPAAELAARWKSEGLWNDETIGDLLDTHLRANPELELAVHSLTRPSRSTYAGVATEARRVAAGLRAAGIGPGDLVACQLPNWQEAAATIWGTALLGAVIVPIVHAYGRREVDYILQHAGVRVFVTAARVGRLDLLAGADERPALAALDRLVVVGSPAEPLPEFATPYAEFTECAPWTGRADVAPDAPVLVAFTSGTTANPKGVVHTHRTLGAEIRQCAAMLPPTRDRITVSPVGHFGGMLTGLFVPVLQGSPIHLMDGWDADRVMTLMTEEGLSAGGGPTFFLTSMLDHPGLTEEHLRLMRYCTLGGAAVPETVARRAAARGIILMRSYGSTEHPTSTGTRYTDPEEPRLTTDGRPLPGVEVRIVDDEGHDCEAGIPGEILTRGPDCFVGYTDPELTDRALDADGWYRTEDIGILNDAGFLTITDRKKDVIIRGGENISAAEVEEVIAGLLAVAEVAVVGTPDARYGERVCAVVRLRDGGGASPTLEDLWNAAARAGLGRQKWPEAIHVVEDFPRTPFGKIRKRDLRDRLRAG